MLFNMSGTYADTGLAFLILAIRHAAKVSNRVFLKTVRFRIISKHSVFVVFLRVFYLYKVALPTAEVLYFVTSNNG